MLKKILFQVHWFIGITAGLILAIVGSTGALLAFETPIQNWLNRDARTVVAPSPESPMLSPTAMIRAIAEQAAGKRVTSLQFSGDPSMAVRVNFAPPAGGASSAGSVGGRPRGETRYANPYTGALIEGNASRGETFFRTTRSIHRWLVAGEFGNQDVGRQIVGASTLLCIFLALSGLYLRWPRRLGNWRVWLTFNPAMKGRAFLWHLHAVLGTWVLIGFLLMSATGLYWSYEWYRNGLFAMAGVDPPAPRTQRSQAGQARGESERRGERSNRGEGAPELRDEQSLPIALDAAWMKFRDTVAESNITNATLAFEPGRPIEVRYLLANASHDRSNNSMTLDPQSGEMLKHDLYEAKRTGEKFMASIFPLHSGSFFGLPGVVAYMIASLAMPVFTITGWMLYLDRRRRKRALPQTDSSGYSPNAL
ncbi:MAG TPA: PepSY-associated TM helix domain-containing protein [Steroidobacteraceae bacterium]|nr:PepSY-associated TM helix domain-containing protein [Steroidobacteraceae bacterium]